MPTLLFFGNPDNEIGINFVLNEGKVIGARTIPFIGSLFLFAVGVMLFFTQFSVLGSTSRIMAENLVLSSPKLFQINKIPLFFYGFLWLQVIAGIIIFSIGFTEPLTLVVLSAVLNAFSMFVYSGLILWMNHTLLDKQLRPNLIRTFMVLAAFIFYGTFSAFTIYQII